MVLSRAWSAGRLQRLLGVRYPVVQGPFGGGPSTVALAATVSNAGGLGSYGAHQLTPDQLTDLVTELRRATAAPFAVNLWVPQAPVGIDAAEFERQVARLRPYLRELGVPEPTWPPPAGPAFAEQAAALLAARPPVMSFVMGVPPADVTSAAREAGIAVLGTATTVDEAVALAEAGVSAVVASGSDAGGHRGAFLRPAEESLVGTFSLVPQVADAVSVPVIAAGGIADARGVVAALALGADGVQIGSAFLATDESAAHPVHKRALHSPEARATVLTRVFTGRHARAIPNRFVREMAAHEADVPAYPVQNALTQALRRTAHPDVLHLWAGQAAPLTAPGPAAEFFARLVAETERALTAN